MISIYSIIKEVISPSQEYIERVMASSEAEAIEKAKQGTRKGAMSSSFEIRKAK